MQPKQTKSNKKCVLLVNLDLLHCCRVLQSESDLSDSEMQPKQTRGRKKGVLIIIITLLVCCRVFTV